MLDTWPLEASVASFVDMTVRLKSSENLESAIGLLTSTLKLVYASTQEGGDIMPITMHKDYGYSQTPSYKTEERKVTLSEAFKLGSLGAMDAMDIYSGSPQEVQKMMNEACQSSFGQDFEHLKKDEQKNVFDMFLIALENSEESGDLEAQSQSSTTTPQPEVSNETPNATLQSEEESKSSNATPKAKKWWHVW